jgi:hypothetical protein
LIIQAIGNGNVVIALSSNQVMALMHYLNLGITEEDAVMVHDALHEQGVCVPVNNIFAHLESIRAGIDDRAFEIFPHLMEADELDVEVELEPDTPEIIH